MPFTRCRWKNFLHFLSSNFKIFLSVVAPPSVQENQEGACQKFQYGRNSGWQFCLYCGNWVFRWL